MGLATTGVARPESVMKECGDEWKAAKANSTTNGMTWQEFLAQCRAQKAAAAAAAPPRQRLPRRPRLRLRRPRRLLSRPPSRSPLPRR